MTATELFHAGKLQAAIDEQIQVVRKNPGDQGKRVFLFELLAFAGELDRAAKQLQAVTPENPAQHLAMQTYVLQLESEQKRRAVLAGTARPSFLLEPPAHVAHRLECLGLLKRKEFASARESLQQADEHAPKVQGELNGSPVDGLRDCDDVFASVLEFCLQGEYFWVALEQVEALSMNPPRFPRDLLWVPARLEITGGLSREVFLPAVYPGSHEQADEELKLGQATDWVETEGLVRGVGARRFFVGEDSIGLLEWKTWARA